MNADPIQIYHPSIPRSKRELDLMIYPRSPCDVAATRHKQLDSWTLFELQRETEKLALSPSKFAGESSSSEKIGKCLVLKMSTLEIDRPSRNNRSREGKKQQNCRNEKTKREKSVCWSRIITIPQYDEKERRMIEDAKERRQRLLKEVTEQVNQRRRASMYDSIANLSALVEDDFSTMEDDEDEQHISCFFLTST